MRLVTSFPRLVAGAALLLALPVGHAFAAGPAKAGNFQPKPETYICPNASGGAVDCFLDAVEHLYTMCRQVKSIEIIEFGYDQAEEGANGAKSEYCVDKHKLSIVRPYQAALKEASASRAALEAIRALHDAWLDALVNLRWHPPETDTDYKGRVTLPYETFREQASAIRTALVAAVPPKPARAVTKSAAAKRTH